MQVSTTSPTLCHINSHMYPKLQLKTQLPATPSMYHTLLTPSTFRLHVPYSRIFLPLHSQAQFHLLFSFFFFNALVISLFFKLFSHLLWLCWVFIAMQAFLQLWWACSYCDGFSYSGAQVLGYVGFSSCGSWALEKRLHSWGPWAQWLHGMWDLPESGTKAVSPALAGGFFTEPPRKPLYLKCVLNNLL